MRRCLVVLGLCVALAPTAWAQGATSWELGMYWTYDTTLTWGQTQTASMTLVVVAEVPYFEFGPWAWTVAGIYERGDEIQRLTVKSFWGSPLAYVRWPIAVAFLEAFEPVSWMPSISSLAASLPVSLENRPVRVETVSRAPSPGSDSVSRLDWLDTELSWWETAETVTLVPRDPVELALAAGVFPDAAPLDYERLRGDRHAGTAWWLPDLLCWGLAEGTEAIQNAQSTYQYRIELTAWGVWSETEMTRRVRAALDSTELLGPDETDGMRAYLRSLGLDL